jgi:hypothetical protein
MNQDQWRNLWRTIGGGSLQPPEINFNTQAVIVAYQGQAPTSAGVAIESIRLESIVHGGQSIIVKTREQSASPADKSAEPSSPFVAVSFQRPPEGTSISLDNDEDVIKAEQNRYEKRRVLRVRRRGRRR